MTKLGNINSQTDMVDSVNGQTGAVVVAPGIAAGGTTSQKLVKKSATDYDTQWNPAWAENAYVGINAPTGTPKVGDLWYDSDDPNPLTLPLSIASGGTGATTASGARSGLAVPGIGNSTTVGGAPTTGTWARGDQWLDSANVTWTCTVGGTPGTWTAPPGTELVYAQVVVPVALTATSAATATLVVDGGTRTFDGTPIIVEFNCHVASSSGTTGQVIFTLWDNATDTGNIGMLIAAGATQMNAPVYVRRRITPTAGSHNYRVGGYSVGATGTAYAAAGGAGQWNPMFIRITRA